MSDVGLPAGVGRLGAAERPPTAPAVLAEAREARGDVEAAMRRLSALAADPVSWPAEDRQALLAWADRTTNAIAVLRAGLLVAERRAGTWRRDGDRSLEEWRSHTSGVGARVAATQVREAEQLAVVPAAAAAVTEGRIGWEHAAVIARVAATGTPAQQAALSAGGQAELLDLAREQDAGTFATTVARWAATVDPDRSEADHQAQHRERFLHLTTTPRGTVVRARLDAMAGHRFTLALEALTPRPAADDDRDPGQRAADALDTMSTQILSAATTKPGAHVPPHVSLLVTEETWAAAREHRDRQRATARAGVDGVGTVGSRAGSASSGPLAPGGDAAATAPGAGHAADVAVGYPPTTLEDGTPVPVSEVARVMCDCASTRVVVDAAGVPLDLGRTQRLFTGEQRRAIIARDRECIWAGCHQHARWCEIHHRVWWERDGGRTSVDDGVLMCSFHHHETHRLDLAVVRITTAQGDGPLGGGPPGGGQPGRGGPSGRLRAAGSALTSVQYEFRDPTGRLVGQGRRPALAALGATRRPHPGDPTDAQGADELDLGWTTDARTRAGVPALVLSG